MSTVVAFPSLIPSLLHSIMPYRLRHSAPNQNPRFKNKVLPSGSSFALCKKQWEEVKVLLAEFGWLCGGSSAGSCTVTLVWVLLKTLTYIWNANDSSRIWLTHERLLCDGNPTGATGTDGPTQGCTWQSVSKETRICSLQHTSTGGGKNITGCVTMNRLFQRRWHCWSLNHIQVPVLAGASVYVFHNGVTLKDTIEEYRTVTYDSKLVFYAFLVCLCKFRISRVWCMWFLILYYYN